MAASVEPSVLASVLASVVVEPSGMSGAPPAPESTTPASVVATHFVVTQSNPGAQSEVVTQFVPQAPADGSQV